MPFKTADLCDENEGKVQVVQPGLINFGGNSCFSGEIQTIKSFEDFSRVREQVHLAGHGKVLVVDNDASMQTAMLGDLLAAAAIENGIASSCSGPCSLWYRLSGCPFWLPP